MKKLIKLISYLFSGLSLEEQCKNSKKEAAAAVQQLANNKVELIRIKSL